MVHLWPLGPAYTPCDAAHTNNRPRRLLLAYISDHGSTPPRAHTQHVFLLLLASQTLPSCVANGAMDQEIARAVVCPGSLAESQIACLPVSDEMRGAGSGGEGGGKRGRKPVCGRRPPLTLSSFQHSAPAGRSACLDVRQTKPTHGGQASTPARCDKTPGCRWDAEQGLCFSAKVVTATDTAKEVTACLHALLACFLVFMHRHSTCPLRSDTPHPPSSSAPVCARL